MLCKGDMNFRLHFLFVTIKSKLQANLKAAIFCRIKASNFFNYAFYILIISLTIVSKRTKVC